MTRDTLCYATNDNQSAVYGLLETAADFAVVVAGITAAMHLSPGRTLRRKTAGLFY